MASERVFIYPYSLGGFIKMVPDSDPESFRVFETVGHGTAGECTCSRRGSRPETSIPLSRWSDFGREIAKRTIGILAKF